MKGKLNRSTSGENAVLHYADRYFKRTMINGKREYYRSANKAKKQGVVFYALDRYADDLCYEEPEFNAIVFRVVGMPGDRVIVRDPLLSEALLELTEEQRSILLQSVVLQKTMDEIALTRGISRQKAQRCKKKAIRLLRNRMEGGSF